MQTLVSWRGRPRGVGVRVVVAALAGLLGACAPALNWRMVPVSGANVELWLPCRADRFEREVQLAGQARRAQLMSCEADGLQYSVMVWPAAGPADASDLARALLTASAGNLGVAAPGQGQGANARVGGLSGLAGTGRWALAGMGPDGRPRRMDTGLLARPSTVLQLTVVGAALRPDQVAPLFDNLRDLP